MHPLQHADGGGLVHLGGKPSEKSAACDVLAALTACAPQAPLALEPAALNGESSLSSKTEWRLAEAPPFLAQGPPALL